MPFRELEDSTIWKWLGFSFGFSLVASTLHVILNHRKNSILIEICRALFGALLSVLMVGGLIRFVDMNQLDIVVLASLLSSLGYQFLSGVVLKLLAKFPMLSWLQDDKKEGT